MHRDATSMMLTIEPAAPKIDTGSIRKNEQTLQAWDFWFGRSRLQRRYQLSALSKNAFEKCKFSLHIVHSFLSKNYITRLKLRVRVLLDMQIVVLKDEQHRVERGVSRKQEPHRSSAAQPRD